VDGSYPKGLIFSLFVGQLVGAQSNNIAHGVWQTLVGYLVVVMNPNAESEIDTIAQRIMSEVEKTSTKDLENSDEVTKILHLTDVRRAKKILQHLDEASTNAERNIGKKAVIEALLLSTWLQRLYFIIRSFIMGIISGVITFSVIFYFGSLNVPLGLALGIVGFISSLVISRLFDAQIVSVTKKIVSILGGHRKLRNFIISHF
jgi:hypothetical protein